MRMRAATKPASKARRARPSDARAIHALVAHYAAQGLLLPRSETEIRAHADRFLVIVEGKTLLGCVALEPYGKELAEIRSVAVDDAARGRGLGARLIEYALAEARRRGYARVFATTHAPDIFTQHGFKAISRHFMPEKIERDCRTCPKSSHCEKLALVAVLAPERVTLPIHQPAIAL
jgi:amino-acid N-acetyltransferase